MTSIICISNHSVILELETYHSFALFAIRCIVGRISLLSNMLRYRITSDGTGNTGNTAEQWVNVTR